MKKTSLWLCLAMSFGLAAGCSDNSKSSTENTEQNQEQNQNQNQEQNQNQNQSQNTVVACSKDNCSATCCGNVCRDTTDNHEHCGACNHACGINQICQNSECVDIVTAKCGPGEIECDEDCTAVMHDNANCGACGKACQDGEKCENGSCEIDCKDQLRCDGACFDSLSDRTHCGNCMTACAENEACINGRCTSECPEPGNTMCDLVCVDTTSDPARCGSCDYACGSTERCVDSHCIETCEAENESICNHLCTDLNSDNDHCGSCETACTDAERCVEGVCSPDCEEEGLMICGHSCTDLMTCYATCVRGGNVCGVQGFCMEGTCLTACEEDGQIVCDHVCTDILSNSENCGACGTMCGDHEICREGHCGCPDDNPDCNLKCKDGTEACHGACIDMENDAANCGECGNSCGAGNVCVNGACIDCADKVMCDDGICYDIQSDPNNCGGCGNACPNHVACVEGACAGCVGDFIDCDGDPTNGCENTTAECECASGDVRECYYGPVGTKGVGACHAGSQTCNNNKWGACVGMVVPSSVYTCRKDIADPKLNDLNCDGKVDGTEDFDKDGYSICDGDCCDIAGQNEACMNIKNPEVIRPGIIDIPGDKIDNNCNGVVDETPATCTASYTQGVDLSEPENRADAALQLARAMDICADASKDGYGLVSATVQSLNAGSPGNTAMSSAINVFSSLGKPTPIITPKAGSSFAGISSGSFQNANLSNGASFIAGGTIPSKYYSAHGNKLQTVIGCEAGSRINDSVDLRLTLKAPQNATGFQFDFRFYSHEYPSFICTQFNDFFIALLDSKATGIPADGNIVFDKNGNPVSVNNAFFTSCEPKSCGTCPANYDKGCVAGKCQTIYGACPDGTADLPAFGSGGGASAWLTTKAPIIGGETFTLDFIIWDTGDSILDSAAIIDNFRWITDSNAVVVGTDFTEPRT